MSRTLNIAELSNSIVQRFWRMATKAEGCWGWSGTKTQFGYPMLWVGEEIGSHPAHRLSLMIHGDFPEVGQIAMHSCDNPGCVNPSHLSWGTYKDNTADKFAKERGNLPRGSCHWSAKLTEEDVRTIRQTTQWTHGQLAKYYNVSDGTIRRIRLRESWAHV